MPCETPDRFPGFQALTLSAGPVDPLPATEVVEGMERFWNACLAGGGTPQPTLMFCRPWRVRRRWRGKTFSYLTTLGDVLKHMRVR